MKVDWTPLRQILKEYRREGLDLPLWWRDDDATEPTAALHRLLETAISLGMPVHLAVIPKQAKADLALVRDMGGMLIPVAHGWQHRNNAPASEKRSEFGTPRPDAADEINMSFDRMQALFGAAFLPLFVPPWNRFHPSHASALHPAGFRGISTFPSRMKLGPIPGVRQIDTHIDPIDWHGTYGLRPPEEIIENAVCTLRQRQSGIEDRSEPLGMLTHHLVHTEEVWQFSQSLLDELLQGGARVQPLKPLLEGGK